MKKQSDFTAPVRIRHAAQGDERGMRALGAALWFGKNASQDARVDAAFCKYWDEKYLGALCAMPSCAFVVAHDAKAIVGLALANTCFDHPQRAKLSRFCLLPSYQGRGIESRLLCECEACLPASVKQLITCIPNNDDEQRQLFDKTGFVPVRMFQMGEPAQGFCELVKALERETPPGAPSPLKQLTQRSPLNWN